MLFMGWVCLGEGEVYLVLYDVQVFVEYGLVLFVCEFGFEYLGFGDGDGVNVVGYGVVYDGECVGQGVVYYVVGVEEVFFCYQWQFDGYGVGVVVVDDCYVFVVCYVVVLNIVVQVDCE